MPLTKWPLLAMTISQNGTEHLEDTEQLCKSLLKCLIPTYCISLARAQWALHAGTLVAAWDPCCCKELALKLHGWKLTYCRNFNAKIHLLQYGYQHVGLVKFHPVIHDQHFVKMKHRNKDLHSCSVFFHCSILFCEIASAPLPVTLW